MKILSCFKTRAERLDAFRAADIYPVISSEFCSGRNPLDIAIAALAGGAKIIQMREKNLPDSDFFQLLCACRKHFNEARALLIVDDRVDLALAADADGVHLGQEDMPVSAAKEIAPQLLFGISTHNKEELLTAQRENPDGYLNIGPIFPTGTKTLPHPPLGLELLENLIPQTQIPFSVMGGIKENHLAVLKSLGVRHPACVTAITMADKPEEVVKIWRKKLLA